LLKKGGLSDQTILNGDVLPCLWRRKRTLW
jgi:hypothetical protein